MKRLALVLLLALAVITVSFAGCLYPDEDDEEEYPGSFKDQVGNVVNIEDVPERIVSLAPSLTEIVFELEIQDMLVGRDEASPIPRPYWMLRSCPPGQLDRTWN